MAEQQQAPAAIDKTQPGGLYIVEGKTVDANGYEVQPGQRAEADAARYRATGDDLANNSSIAGREQAPEATDASLVSTIEELERTRRELEALRARLAEGEQVSSPTMATAAQQQAAVEAQVERIGSEIEVAKQAQEQAEAEQVEGSKAMRDEQVRTALNSKVGELRQVVQGINDVKTLTAMRRADDRSTADAIYAERIAEIKSTTEG